MKREELLAEARKHVWAAWQLSSEELAAQAVVTLHGMGMLVPEGGAAELEKLRARVAELEAAPTIVYRASHDSIVMGLYTTREAARAHCETDLRREVGSTMLLSWVPDDGSDLAVEELCTGQDAYCSGYIVTPLEVAAAYDEEADE